MIDVLVGIPWRRQQSRELAYRKVLDWYHDASRYFETASFIVRPLDTDDQPFNLAACRNRLAQDAWYDIDVMVLNDADTLPEQGPLFEAIRSARGDTKVHLPYTQYCSLRLDGTEQYLSGRALKWCDSFIVESACSGVYVATPETWLSCPQDERFKGWGFEDAAWLAAHRTLIGEPVRHDGRVYSMHHESAQKSGPQYEANAALCYRYLQAEGDPEAMRALLAERDTEEAP